MKKNNFLVLFVILFVSSTFAEVKYELAKVKRSSIDLYEQANELSTKQVNRYLYNDVIKIYSCNKEYWCKTDNGYVKQHLIKFDTLKDILKEQGTISAINPTKKLQRLWNNNKMFFRISVDESILDILSAIALQNGSKIIFDKNIEGVETINIEDMPLEGAFNLILQRNNLEYKWQQNTLIVNSVKNTKIKKEFIILKNITIDKLIVLLKRYNIYTKIQNKVIFDKEMNAVYIEAQDEVIQELQKILMQFETAEKLLRETRIKRTQEEIKYKKLEHINKKRIAIMDKKKKYGLNEYDDWKMVLEIIPLKYISVTQKEMEFQGKIIRLESLDETLKGLLGTGYSNNINIVSNDINKTDLIKAKTVSKEKSYLKIDARTNSIIIKDFPDRIIEIKEIIAKLDTPAKLIQIEVTIATGTTGFTNQLGIALGAGQKSSNRVSGIATSSDTATVTNEQVENTPSVLLKPAGALGLSGSMLFSGSKNMINAQLNAMESDGLGKVLSNPKVVTLNNAEATIHSGTSISIPVTKDGKTTLEKVDTGISIKSTPHIIEKDKDESKDIMLDISVESSSLGDSTGDKINKSTNNINTNVIMRDGQTLILGGLFQYTQSDTVSGVPVLKDIPILGFLFSTKSKILNKSELVFFITPKIITSDMVTNMQNNKVFHYKDSMEVQKKKFDLKQVEKVK
jgi:type II secretory pathway component GspD/PulD (secretin)